VTNDSHHTTADARGILLKGEMGFWNFDGINQCLIIGCSKDRSTPVTPPPISKVIKLSTRQKLNLLKR